jgi:hypothetical protein
MTGNKKMSNEIIHINQTKILIHLLKANAISTHIMSYFLTSRYNFWNYQVKKTHLALIMHVKLVCISIL